MQPASRREFVQQKGNRQKKENALPNAYAPMDRRGPARRIPKTRRVKPRQQRGKEWGNYMNEILLIATITGLIMIVVSIPFLMGKVPPNRWAGFRVRATLNDPILWTSANAYVAKYLLGVGAVLILWAVFSHFLALPAKHCAQGVTSITLVGIGLTLIQGLRFIKINKSK